MTLEKKERAMAFSVFVEFLNHKVREIYRTCSSAEDNELMEVM